MDLQDLQATSSSSLDASELKLPRLPANIDHNVDS